MFFVKKHWRKIIVGLSIFTFLCLIAPKDEKFDAVKWRNAEYSDRSRMIDDLLKHTYFQGMSRTEVTDMLGEPNRNWAFPGEWDIVYLVGPERNWLTGVDSEWLVFKFDRQDRVSEFKVVTD